jgi:hypothetical protein
MSKFTKTLVLILLATFATALWFNFPIPLFLGLITILLIMSWATIIDSLTKRK